MRTRIKRWMLKSMKTILILLHQKLTNRKWFLNISRVMWMTKNSNSNKSSKMFRMIPVKMLTWLILIFHKELTLTNCRLITPKITSKSYPRNNKLTKMELSKRMTLLRTPLMKRTWQVQLGKSKAQLIKKRIKTKLPDFLYIIKYLLSIF